MTGLRRCLYTMEYYSAIKKNEIMPFTESQMDLEVGILSEVRKGEEEKSVLKRIILHS